MKRAVSAFLAGFVAVLTFHQGVLWLFHAMHQTDHTPWVMKGVPPFGVPAVISLAFWGGVWGVIMILAIARVRGIGYWLAAIVFGAILPTLVAAFVVAPLKGQSMAGGGHSGKMLVFGLCVNGAWGLGTAIFYRLFGGK
jgi:hypothetical protein